MRPSRVLSWLELLAAWLLIIVLFVIVLAVSGALTAIITDSRTADPLSVFGGKPAAAHHSHDYVRDRFLSAVRHCESGGDYTAVNMEYHAGWDTYGSFGAYQIAQPLWDEQLALEGLDEWQGWFPHMTPPRIQDQVAEGLYDRFSSTGQLSMLWRHMGEC